MVDVLPGEINAFTDKRKLICLVTHTFIVKARDVDLTHDAKKGLESKEDIHGASQSLRVTEKCQVTGVGTEKTNPYDGVKDVMLFHIKGMREIEYLIHD